MIIGIFQINLHDTVFESLTVAIDNIHFFYFSGIMRSFNLLNVLLKNVCNISNKFALQICKNIHIFLDVLFSGLYFFRFIIACCSFD